MAQQVAQGVSDYRVSLGLNPLDAYADESMTPDSPAGLHAQGYTDASSIVDAWIDSPEHQQAMTVRWDTEIGCGSWDKGNAHATVCTSQ